MQSTLQQNNQRSRSFIGSLIVAIVFLAASLFLTLNRGLVLDVFHFWTYRPTTDLASVATKAAFTDTGLFTFYAVRPEIAAGQSFNDNCRKQEQGTAILGCYVDNRIYLFDVTDSRLSGIKEVTAAHEMLHAAYQRLSDEDKSKVNVLLEAEFEKLKNNPSFTDRMAFYSRNEPGERDNELHSIIGTEVASISPELERHYAKYFKNRQNIITLFNGYNSVFLSLDKQARSLSAQLDALSKSIDASIAQYNSEVKDLNQAIAYFNRRAAAGSFSSVYAFNAERRTLQNRVIAVNNLRTTLSNEILRYESMRKEYNKIVTESNTLYKSIDSTLAPAPQV